VQFDALLALVALGLWLFALFDVITTDSSLCRNLPKLLWVLLVVVLFDIGAVAWLLLGRPQRAGAQLGTTQPRRARPPAVKREATADFVARIEARDRLLAEWAEEDKRKAADRDAASRADAERLAELEKQFRVDGEGESSAGLS